CVFFFFFFFQAEDGIRDKLVTGVQTCALPILSICRSARANRERAMRRNWMLFCCFGVTACLVRTAIAQEHKESEKASESAATAGLSATNSIPSHDRASPQAFRSSASEDRAARIEGEK